MEEDFTLIARPDGTYRIDEGGQHFVNPIEVAFGNWFLSGGDDRYLARAFSQLDCSTDDGEAYGWAITNHAMRYAEAEVSGLGATARFIDPAQVYGMARGMVDSWQGGGVVPSYPDGRPGGFETSRDAQFKPKVNTRLERLADEILDWIGPDPHGPKDGTGAFRNKTGDLTIIGGETGNQLEIHIVHPDPHENAHFHWGYRTGIRYPGDKGILIREGPIYFSDVPHR